MQWYYILCVLTAFPFQTRSAVGPPSYLLPVPQGCLREGGTQAAVGLGREIKHLNSAPQPDATEEDCRQTLNSGWMLPWARHLLDFVGSLDRYQAEKAQEQDEHGTVLCQLHREQSGLTEIKLILQIRNIFRTRFFAYCLCTTQQHTARATVAFLVLIQWKCHTFEP